LDVFVFKGTVQGVLNPNRPLVQQFLDVWPLRALRLGDRAPLLQGSWSVAEATAEDLQVGVTLVAQLGVGCGTQRWESELCTTFFWCLFIGMLLL